MLAVGAAVRRAVAADAPDASPDDPVADLAGGVPEPDSTLTVA